MQFSPRTVKGYRQAQLEFRARLRLMTQTQIAVRSGTTVQAVCDVVKRRRPLNALLLRWLGFELAYLPIQKRPIAHSAPMPEADRPAASPQQAADSEEPVAAPPGAEV